MSVTYEKVNLGKVKGEDGVTPYISEDGYWVVNGVKTDTPASGVSSGGNVDMSGYATDAELQAVKNEVEEMINNANVDLSGAYTKNETDEKIKAARLYRHHVQFYFQECMCMFTTYSHSGTAGTKISDYLAMTGAPVVSVAGYSGTEYITGIMCGAAGGMFAILNRNKKVNNGIIPSGDISYIRVCQYIEFNDGAITNFLASVIE